MVERDLAVVLSKATPYAAIEEVIEQAKLPFLQNVQLFDIFESDKLGADKKSVVENPNNGYNNNIGKETNIDF